MINAKITGAAELIAFFQKEGAQVDAALIDAAVKKSAVDLIQTLKAAYGPYKRTGTLIDSIEAFQRKRRGNSDPYFTYYIGPRFTGGGKLGSTAGLRSYGGNAAWLLEYGTKERYRADVKKGGASFGKGRVYGAKHSTGVMPGFGVIRSTVGSNFNRLAQQVGRDVLKVIEQEFRKQGFK